MSYAQQNEAVYRILIFCLLQYGITKWLVDTQNSGTLTGEKFKKILLLKTYSSTR